MIILDVNVLLYAYNEDSPNYRAARRWLQETLAGQETVGLPWPTLWAFVRIGTSARAMPTPITPRQAFQVIDELLALPQVVIVEPGRRHAELLRNTIESTQATGPLVSDAVLAALAYEHGASVASTDYDFSRFPNLKWVNPLPPQ